MTEFVMSNLQFRRHWENIYTRAMQLCLVRPSNRLEEVLTNNDIRFAILSSLLGTMIDRNAEFKTNVRLWLESQKPEDAVKGLLKYCTYLADMPKIWELYSDLVEKRELKHGHWSDPSRFEDEFDRFEGEILKQEWLDPDKLPMITATPHSLPAICLDKTWEVAKNICADTYEALLNIDKDTEYPSLKALMSYILEPDKIKADVYKRYIRVLFDYSEVMQWAWRNKLDAQTLTHIAQQTISRMFQDKLFMQRFNAHIYAVWVSSGSKRIRMTTNYINVVLFGAMMRTKELLEKHKKLYGF